jgi:hypothetical protein
LNEINSNYSGVLLHTSVRWLSRGKVIERFFSLRQEIILFLHENNKVYHELENDEWCSLLAFLCDITEKLSELNRGLQGENKIISQIANKVFSFDEKLHIYHEEIQNQILHNFPTVIKEFEQISGFTRYQEFCCLWKILGIYITSAETTEIPPEVRSCGRQICGGCSYTHKQFYQVMSSEEALLGFFFNHGTISCHYRCPKCKTLLDYCSHSGALVFRCQTINKKKNRRRCDTRVSIFKFTYFDNVHLSLTLIAGIVLLYLTRPPPRCQFIAKETNVSHRILIDYFNFIREVLIFWAHNNSEQIGGEGKIVEIDEAKIGKRKYNRGRYLEEQWVFGGIERGSNIFF